MNKIIIVLTCMLLATHAANADGRTVMFLKGVAYGIANQCPDLQVDTEAVRKTKVIAGNRPGDFYDFMDGMIYTSKLIKSKEQTCDNICGIRPGTCYFVKGQ